MAGERNVVEAVVRARYEAAGTLNAFMSDLDRLGPKTRRRGGRPQPRRAARLRAGPAPRHDRRADARWVWDILLERARTGVDNRGLTDNFAMPGTAHTRVLEQDAQGRPTWLSS